MKPVIINDRAYHITWQHTNNTGAINKDGTHKKLRSSSQCIISIIGSELFSDDKPLSGLAICNPNDNYNKKEGIKLSFSKAVSQIPDRNIRKELWKAFWDRIVKSETTYYYYEDKPYKVLYEGKAKVNSLLQQVAQCNNNAKYVELLLIEDKDKWMDVVIYEPLYPECGIRICVKEKNDFYQNYKTKANGNIVSNNS